MRRSREHYLRHRRQLRPAAFLAIAALWFLAVLGAEIGLLIYEVRL